MLINQTSQMTYPNNKLTGAVRTRMGITHRLENILTRMAVKKILMMKMENWCSSELKDRLIYRQITGALLSQMNRSLNRFKSPPCLTNSTKFRMMLNLKCLRNKSQFKLILMPHTPRFLATAPKLRQKR